MRKVVLVANTCKWLPYNKSYDYIGVDKGAMYCLLNNIPMVCAVGDFDSLETTQFEKLRTYTKLHQLPCRKNETDGEYAIRFAKELGYEDIEVYGVTGGRLDHFITILNLLLYHDISFKIVDEQNTLYCLKAGEYKIKKNSKYLSLYACEEMNITLTGVEYPLDNIKISSKDLYLISNEIKDEFATLKTNGKILIVESNDKN